MLLIPANNGFWYDHGVEIVAAIATFAAVGVAMLTSWYTVSKDRKNKEDDNNKTLYMLDLLTLKNRSVLYQTLNKIQNADYKKPKQDDIKYIKEYYVNITENQYPTMKNDLVKLFWKQLEFDSNFLVEEIDSYKSTLENIIKEQYSNLYFESIKKVEDKIGDLVTLLNTIEMIRSSKVPSVTAYGDPVDVIKADEVPIILNYYKKLVSDLSKGSKSISDNSYPLKESEESQNE